MDAYQILCLFGVPTLVATVVGIIVKIIFSHVKKQSTDMESMKLGLQALLRSQMIHDWNKYNELGYAPIYARENFENCWLQYHSLGANGVMDNIHEKFLRLPIEPKGEVEHEGKS